MRATLIIALAFVAIVPVHAQDQERKLLDRILKPNMSLQAGEEKQQFVAGGQVLTKKAPTRWFFFKPRSLEREYAGVKPFQAKEFATRQSRFAGQQANTSTHTKLTKVDEPFRTTAFVTRDAHDSRRIAETRDYPGVRPFLVKGKSQKLLSAKDRPMTIDEVRELLNKNK